jgi:hypothetical protein
MHQSQINQFGMQQARTQQERRGQQLTTEETTGSDCEHFWMIESPNGPTSIGTCQHCGDKSEFRNSMPGSGWDRESPQAKRARQQSNANAKAKAKA